MKAIVIGASLSGKTTLINQLRSLKNLPLLEIDDELTRINGGQYPDNVEYKHNILVPQIIKNVLGKQEIIFFTNTDYLTEEDLQKARSLGFKIIQLEISLEELERRNNIRVQNEGHDDWGQWLGGMVKYQTNIKEKGLVDKVLSMNQPTENAVNELLTFLGA